MIAILVLNELSKLFHNRVLKVFQDGSQTWKTFSVRNDPIIINLWNYSIAYQISEETYVKHKNKEFLLV